MRRPARRAARAARAGAGAPAGRAAGRRPARCRRGSSEIATLVAEGLGNRAIAQRLTLPERTVENRVSQIMRKLDRPLRVAVAAWVRER
ncbi:LuxR C-terminal-related transcriptional regulator [Pseudonocardia oceani]|uniref:LuxR C-terminal-related transcriptional regulator n=1 Tax=Pseudonocardia oceani TaxID=2792013 RepID=UPI001C49F4BD|nr:LuxR C-terminal-related transcriptional regulator [Pseudonocardia oceani]